MFKFPSTKGYENMYVEYLNISRPIHDRIHFPERVGLPGSRGRKRYLKNLGRGEEFWRDLYLIHPLAVSTEEYDEDVQLKILKGELAPPPPRIRSEEEMARIRDEDADFHLLDNNSATAECANLLEFLKKASPDNPEHIKIVNEIVAHLKYARFGTLGAALIKELGEITFEPTVEITELKIPEVTDLKKAIEVFRSLVVQIPYIVPSDYDVLLRFYQRVPRQLSTASVGTEASSSSSDGKIEINLTKQTTIQTGPGHHGDIHVEDKSSCVIL